MSEDFNACVKSQLLTYVPMALKKQLQKHDKVIGQNTQIEAKDKALDVTATMKATLEQQKAAKAVVAHIETLVKLARLVVDDAIVDAASEENKQELLDIIEEAQTRVSLNRELISGEVSNE